MFRHPYLTLIATSVAIVGGQSVLAQSFPADTIRFVVGYPPGGSTDISARAIANYLSQNTDANFIVENRAGGSGIVGASSVANAEADGYTLLFAASPEVALVEALDRQTDYDVEEDFRPITLIGQVEYVLVGRAGLPASDLNELVAYAEKNPDTLSFASFGIGTSNHLAGEAFKSATNTDFLHVPYNGSAPGMVDLLGGRVDIAFDTVPVVMPHLENGDLTPIGIATAERSDLMPDLPTLAEQGLDGFVAGTWFGLFAPAATDDDTVAWLNDSLGEALSDPELRADLNARGVALRHTTPDELSEFVSEEIKRWGKVVETAGISVN